MADTKELQKYFGQPGRQQEGCGFPAGHLLMLFDAASGFLVKQLAFPGSTHDLSQVSALHPELEKGDVLDSILVCLAERYTEYPGCLRENVRNI